MRFREDSPQELARARAAVAAWRDQNPGGTSEDLVAAIGQHFRPDYGVVLRALLFAADRHQARVITGGRRERRPGTGPVMAGVAEAALDEVVCVRFGEEDLRRIRALAVIHGRTPSAVIREACSFYLSHQAGTSGVAEEPAGAGACGSVGPETGPS